jgi:hypothetical protein
MGLRYAGAHSWLLAEGISRHGVLHQSSQLKRQPELGTDVPFVLTSGTSRRTLDSRFWTVAR